MNKPVWIFNPSDGTNTPVSSLREFLEYGWKPSVEVIDRNFSALDKVVTKTSKVAHKGRWRGTFGLIFSVWNLVSIYKMKQDVAEVKKDVEAIKEENTDILDRIYVLEREIKNLKGE